MRSSASSDAKRLADLLRHEIREGKYAADELFPSLRTLAERHGVGLCAVRMATDTLVNEHLLYRRPRSGTFVRRVPRLAPESQRPGPIQCVTVFERPTGILPSFVRVNYLEGYTQALDKFHARLRIMGLPVTLDQIEPALSSQYPLQEQGAILVNVIQEPVIRWFGEHRIPFVVQNYTQYPHESLPAHHSVTVNKVGGAFAATRHLIERGHRRIGYAGTYASERPEDTRNSNEVYCGYVAAMLSAGLEPRTGDLVAYHTDDPGSACSQVLPLIRGRDLPTAFVAQTDSVAIGLVQAARELGVRVPEQLSVVGFNDQHEAARCDPPLTTVAVPRVQLGCTAMEVLMSTANATAPAEPVSIVLECHLIERDSVADAVTQGNAR